MRHPFQCIAAVKPPVGERAYLLAACGPKLLSTCLTTGHVVSEWTASDHALTASKPQGAEQSRAGNGEWSSKKQKTASSPASSLPNIIKLSVAPDQVHAVAVTEDKCIRVFNIEDDGKLAELSSRAMPKRPCAIQILPDNATILCGDKFGDVYSLPLLLNEPNPKDGTDDTHPPEPTPENKPFKPSATTQTVHTKRNLKALESQMKQKNLTPKSKQPLAFDHHLLLGHVSMLTDVAYATRPVDGKQRHYIITADRDEHIRVSRGPPQSHIIETYCLGHNTFVSKLCVLPGTDLLLSGGGDEWLGLWNWPEGRLKLELHDFGRAVREVLEESKGFPPDKPDHIAISGLWRVTANLHEREGTADAVLIACEGLPVLADCPVAEFVNASSDGGPSWSFSAVDGPVLDVTCVDSRVYVSYDVREAGHRPLRVSKICVKETAGGTTILEFEEDGNAEGEALLERTMECAAMVESGKATDNLLYGVANLRKRAHQSEAVDDDPDAAGGAAD